MSNIPIPYRVVKERTVYSIYRFHIPGCYWEYVTQFHNELEAIKYCRGMIENFKELLKLSRQLDYSRTARGLLNVTYPNES